MIATARKAWVAKTLKDVAEFFGVEHGSARRWATEGMPGNPGSYNLSQIYQWLKKRQKPVTKRSLMDRKMREEIRFRRLKNDEFEGRLVYRDEVEQSAAELCQRVRQRLEAVPDELEIELPSDNRTYLKQRLEDKVRLILTEMSQWEIGSAGA